MASNKVGGVVYEYRADVAGLEEENKFLRENVAGLERELAKFRQHPLIACEIKDVFDQQALIRLPNGNEFMVDVAHNCDVIIPGDGVLAEQKNLTIVSRIAPSKKFDVEKFVIIERPDISWKQVGGLGPQEKEIKEVIELPLTKPELFVKIGIEPPKGLLLHGPPGTGKTLLAKAVAASTKSTFIEVVGSELVQKFIGEGAKLVKEIFQLAREKAPSIVFIDELDAIAATRVDIGTSGEREVQRTFMQLLAEIDGFKNLDNVKIIGCTNRKDILDPAILRPGRLDRLIQVDLPTKAERKDILSIYLDKMPVSGVEPEVILKKTEGFSGADIKSLCTEAGYYAIRRNRRSVQQLDFLDAVEKIVSKEHFSTDHLSMFG
ncbi:MAG: AAA family ATPase [Candidatus Woesearchaeota archaeon]|jgi:proteasome regulatory subunit|nr:AAA family ATPase [Candidatus Woesearchaeota archaeon]MDP7198896.1 AAA family ATPase [Candidatus Woesearchaeota archaeon]MDP7467104.1 AAA family ATPase [Candidatus Woesearchaeota archaeon]